MKSTTRQFIKANQEVDRALEAFKEEREIALSRQKLALERYEEEMREVGDLDDIDREIHQ